MRFPKWWLVKLKIHMFCVRISRRLINIFKMPLNCSPISAHPQINFWIGAWNPNQTGALEDLTFDDGTSAKNTFQQFDVLFKSQKHRCGFLLYSPTESRPLFAFHQTCITNDFYICEYSCQCQKQGSIENPMLSRSFEEGTEKAK